MPQNLIVDAAKEKGSDVEEKWRRRWRTARTRALYVRHFMNARRGGVCVRTCVRVYTNARPYYVRTYGGGGGSGGGDGGTFMRSSGKRICRA